MLEELTSAEVTDWLAFYKVRPFGYVRFARMFGELAAQQHNIHKSRGRDRGWKDFFPVEVIAKGKDGRDSNARIIAMFRQYNLERGYGPDGKKVK